MEAKEVLKDLLETTKCPIALHADIGTTNIMHSGNRGWLAIDPKSLMGDRCYDVASAFPFQKPHSSMIDIDRVADLTGKFAEQLGYSYERIAKFSFINHANSSLKTCIPEARREGHRNIAASFRRQF